MNVGLDRSLDPRWLDLTAGLLQQERQQARTDLERALSREIIPAEAGRRRTAAILWRIWAAVPPGLAAVRNEALGLVASYGSGDRVAVHWGLLLLAYPVFKDVAAVVGRLGVLQEVVTRSQVERRMIESWGQRSTVTHATRRALATAEAFGVLSDGLGDGSYRMLPSLTLADEVVVWLLDVAVRSSSTAGVPLRELLQAPYLYPFNLTSSPPAVYRSPRFEVMRQSVDLEVVYLHARVTGGGD